MLNSDRAAVTQLLFIVGTTLQHLQLWCRLPVPQLPQNAFGIVYFIFIYCLLVVHSGTNILFPSFVESACASCVKKRFSDDSPLFKEIKVQSIEYTAKIIIFS